jgi:hypothetical protein
MVLSGAVDQRRRLAGGLVATTSAVARLGRSVVSASGTSSVRVRKWAGNTVLTVPEQRAVEGIATSVSLRAELGKSVGAADPLAGSTSPNALHDQCSPSHDNSTQTAVE